MNMQINRYYYFLFTLACSSIVTLPFCSNVPIHTDQHFLSMTTIGNKTKEICQPGYWTLAKGGYYNPASTAIGNPMIKITGSHIELNFDGNFIENNDNNNAGFIGIEVGYSPTELAANSSLRQPKDIVISNAHLRNFDCGILVHKGVERVVIQNSVLLDCSIGISLLGDPDSFPTTTGSQLNIEQIKSAAIVNCKIIGHLQNKRTALVNLKTLIETTYGYSNDLFMPLRADRLNGNLLDVYTYSGIIATHVKNLHMSCLDVQCIGNDDFSSEGNGTRTEAIGIILRDCDEVFMQHCKTSSINGNVKACGLQLERVCGINIEDSQFSYATSNYIATGFETFPDFLAKTFDGLNSGFDFTVEEIDLSEVKTEFQRSANFSIGIFLTDTRGLNGNNIASERNLATTTSLGQFQSGTADITFTNSSFTRNISGPVTVTLKNKRSFQPLLQQSITRNIGAAFEGICSIGAFHENCRNIFYRNITCSSNQGSNTAKGLEFKNCQNCNITSSSFCNNVASEGKRINEDNEIQAAQDINEISKHAAVIEQALTGAYGCTIHQNSENITIQECCVEQNSGHRSAGLLIKDSQQIIINNSTFCYQQATGSTLHPDVQTLSDNNVPFLDIHKPLLTSNACNADATFSRVRYRGMTRNVLNNAREIREDQIRTGVVFSNQRQLVTGMALISASMARFRIWGTAIGIHAHNCKHISISNNSCSSQQSTQDSAIGIAITGRSSQFELYNNNLSYNQAWTDSKQEIWNNSPDPDDPEERYQYNLSALKDFWYFIAGRFATGWDWAANDSSVGFRTDAANATAIPNVLIAQGEQTFGSTGTPTSLPHIRTGGGGGRRHLISLFGPTAAGVLIGDLCVSGTITNNLLHCNFAHAGMGFGIFINCGYSITANDNNIFNNGANIYGFGSGIMDIQTYSTNNYIRNFFNNNKVKKFYNANIMVPMGQVGGNSFQVDSLTNGSYDRNDRPLQNAEINLPIDNDVCLVESELDGAVQNNILATWTSNSWVS